MTRRSIKHGRLRAMQGSMLLGVPNGRRFEPAYCFASGLELARAAPIGSGAEPAPACVPCADESLIPKGVNMPRVFSAILVLAWLWTPGMSNANPDGPIGSITLQPSMQFGPRKHQFAVSPDFKNRGTRTWRASIAATMPVAHFASLGFGFSRELGLSGISRTQGPGTWIDYYDEFTAVTLFARIHLRSGRRVK